VSVMAEIKNAGVEKLGMVTEPPKEKKKPGK
jgi:biopolymer transport protein ExbD